MRYGLGWKKPMTLSSPSRVKRSKHQAGNYYSSISPFYDLLSGGAEGRLREDAICRLGIRPGEKILEIGAGTGSGLRRMAESAGPSGAAVGVDLAEGMLAAARSKLRGSTPAHPVFLARADGMRLPFRSGYFHAAFMSFTLELFDTPEIPAVLAECRRVLMPGGRLGVAAMALAPTPNVMSRLFQFLHAAFPVWVDCRPIDCRRAVGDANFRVVDSARTSLFTLPVDIVIAIK
jgi:ubiquinone/menaquinone biosynthesis C-methylase UbiE